MRCYIREVVCKVDRVPRDEWITAAKALANNIIATALNCHELL